MDSDEIFGFGSDDPEDGSDSEVDGNNIVASEKDNDKNISEQVLLTERIGLENESRELDFDCHSHETDDRSLLEVQHVDPESTRGDDTTICDGQNAVSDQKNYPPPAVGMEFETYTDAYNYYSCYAKEMGFYIRVKSSWTKRNSKEKRGAVLCCNCEGFRTMKQANSRRKETRTGCLAMIRLRLVESNRWKVDETRLEHNHLFDSTSTENSKSQKKISSGTKRKSGPAVNVEVRTIKLYHAPVVGPMVNGSSERAFTSQETRLLKHGKDEAEHINKFLCRMQIRNPNFFYVMDLGEEGKLRNIFWVESRSRAAYNCFGDVMIVDTICLSQSYEIPLLTFTGVNHHGRSILLGCALLGDETSETYVWLLRAWLSCMMGRPPQTIVTDSCMALQIAISEVFPKSHHCFCVPLVMQNIFEKLGDLGQSEVFCSILNRTVYDTQKVDEFETAWEETIQHFDIGGHEWLQTIYDDRERWAPVYLKDTFLAGVFSFQPGECVSSFFEGYVHSHTTLKEFFDVYELVIQRQDQKEAFDDAESRVYDPSLRTSCIYKSQLSDVYTKEIFVKFQTEVELMSRCSSVTQIHANGPTITYIVKERETEGDLEKTRNFEVMYDKVGTEVRCICSCFSFKGYLCRHSLQVLKYNGVDDIPCQYVLSRWRKDFKRSYALEIGSGNVDISNPVQRIDHLYRRAMQVVEEGMCSHEHYMVAWQAFKESLNKVRLVASKHEP